MVAPHQHTALRSAGDKAKQQVHFSSVSFCELGAHAQEGIITDQGPYVFHGGNLLIILEFVGLSIADRLCASPSAAIYLAKKNIKRKGILEEYEKVRRRCTHSTATPSVAV